MGWWWTDKRRKEKEMREGQAVYTWDGMVTNQHLHGLRKTEKLVLIFLREVSDNATKACVRHNKDQISTCNNGLNQTLRLGD